MSYEVKKIIRDGKVGVIISRGYGIGWASDELYYGLHQPENVDVTLGLSMVFCPELIEMIEQADKEGKRITEQQLEEFVSKKWPDEQICCLGADGLTVVWIDQGTLFRIAEYDGAESVDIFNEKHYVKA